MFSINVTQVDEKRNKSGSKDGSTICDNYSRELCMPEDNFFNRLWKSPKEINSMRWKMLYAGGMGTKRQVVVEERTFSFGTPDNA
ncbi:hypothetical protein TNCV_4994131 [Trichonephila clavipes]|nr:hypothetical protein TNCV_4994131 [Trichonephila clavipes]